MPKEKSGVEKPVRVGTCGNCQRAVYAGDEVEYIEKVFHIDCREKQKSEIDKWNEDVRKDEGLEKGGATR